MLMVSSGFRVQNDILSGLVGHYPCDEGTGSTATDITGITGNMAFTGPVTWGATWLTLPGTSAAATTRTFTLTAGQAFSFTASLRLNAANSNTWRVVFDSGSGNTPQLWFTNLISSVDGRLVFDVSGLQTATSYRGEWVHVIASKPSGTGVATYYIDGSPTLGSLSYATTAGNSTFFHRSSASYFYGNVSNIRLYNRAISQSEATEIKELDAVVTTAPTPTYFWPMQEGTGTTFTDTSETQTCTLSSATWGVGSGRNGTNCLVFATSQWAYIADPFYYDPFTVAFWAYPTAQASYKVFMSKRNDEAGVSGTAEWEIYYDTSRRLSFKIWNASAAEIFFIQCAADTITLNAWNHIVCTSGGNGNTGYAYVNGAQVGSAAQGSAMVNTTEAINFGGRTSNADARYYVGRMQEVRIFNFQLSSDQIVSVFNQATP